VESEATVVESEQQVCELVTAPSVMLARVDVSWIVRPMFSRPIEQPKRVAQLETTTQLCRATQHCGGVGGVEATVSGAIISGLDVAYDLGGGHPLLGRRMPDLDLVTADGPISVFSLLHSAKPVLLNFGQAGGFDIAPWAERVQLVDASYAGIWELPVVGEVTAPSAVLVRPDGHVAWVGEGTDAGLRDALTTWFGP